MSVKTISVVLKTSRVGNNLVQSIGDTVEVPEDEGRRMIERGQAERARQQPAQPTAGHEKR